MTVLLRKRQQVKISFKPNRPRSTKSRLNLDLEAIRQWCLHNAPSLNAHKCSVVFISNKIILKTDNTHEVSIQIETTHLLRRVPPIILALFLTAI
jgi:hypothetical protein